MPLLRRQPFQRDSPPTDLHPEEEVFFCKLTNEIFRDYEKFFERIILCNSLVWSCSITGRSGLTYQEAEESEEKALKQLASFPLYLQKPILYLATCTRRSRIADLNDDVFVFAKDRFFIGEMVEVICGSVKKTCKIMRVIPPGGSSVPSTPTTPTVNGEDGEGAPPVSAPPKKKKANKPENFQYVVQEPGKSNLNTVKFKMVSRKKGLYTRDKSKLFLKQNCDNVDGVWRVKESKIKKLSLGSMMFEDVFAGPHPAFEFSEIKSKKIPKKAESKEPSPGPQKQKDKEGKPSSSPQLTPGEIRALKEQEKVMREKEREERIALKIKEKEEIRKKFEEEKEQKRREKAMEMEKKREERRIQAELWKEWRRPREDLDCDDLKELPDPIPVKCRIPIEQFGDAIMVLEFVNCFSTIFDLKASFPKGFTIHILEEALLETDAGGLMADLLLMMLTAIFSLQEEEEEEEAELNKKNKEQGLDDKVSASDMSVNQLIDAATSLSHISQLTHGCTLRKLPLDNFTLTEILRLHVMASGAQGNPGSAKFRYQQRGGYMPIDDAGLEFKKQEPDLVNKLAVENIYDLHPSEKLKILKVLVDQFLTYAATRDLIEDNFDKLRQLRTDLKQLQWSEQRREREETANRYKMRLEEKQKEREILEKKRLLKVKQKIQQTRREEQLKSGADPDQQPMEVDDPVPEIQVTEEEITELEASLPSQEERERLQEQEDDAEADKKAEYMSRERDFLDNILNLQHGNAIYPIGRDRMYRRYWMFRSLPGIFVEHDEELVSEAALKPVLQNPEGSSYDLTDPWAAPPKLRMNKVESEEIKQVESEEIKAADISKDGSSDKENDSMNATGIEGSGLPSDNTSVVNSPVVNGNSVVTAQTDGVIPPGNVINKDGVVEANELNKNETNTVKMNGDAIVISDDDDSNDKPPTLDAEEKVKEIPIVMTPALKQLSKEKHQWAFFSKEEDIELLLDSLNSRGMRENALKNSILEHKNVLMGKVCDVPLDLLYIPDEEDSKDDAMMSPKVRTKEWKRGRRNVTGTVKNDSAHEGLELNLREMVLDLEERIHVGSLGYVRVKDRAAWRDAIENGGYSAQTDDPVFKPEKKARLAEDENFADVSMDKDNTNVTIARDLSKALIQVARGLEPKYMQPPLGDDEKTKQAKQKAAAEAAKKEELKKKNEDDDSDDDEVIEVKPTTRALMERWEDSCLVGTSLSQVFLHLSTLEKSVTWSKSILHTRCKICRRKCDPDKILLCDGCDRGHHMYCLKPPLKHIPKTDWFCPDCKPKETKRSPRKERRRTFSEQPSSDEEEEEEEEEASEDEAEDEGSTDSEELDALCAVCSKGGKLVCCDMCPLSYHKGCTTPPLKKIPKGKWLCQICSGTDVKTGKIKMNLIKGGKKKKSNSPKSSPKNTPNSSRQTSRRGSPRDSPLTLKVQKKRKQTESPAPDEEKPSKIKKSKSTTKLDSPAPDQDKSSKMKKSKSTSKLYSPAPVEEKSSKMKKLKSASKLDSPAPDEEKSSKMKKSKSATKLTQEVKNDEPKHYTSSSRGNVKVQQLKLLEDVVLGIMDEVDAWPFLRPVLKKDAPDYYQLIKKPMDFSTIRNRINKLQYVEPDDIVGDVRQVFTNCIEYNKRTTLEFKAGANLSKLFERRIKNLEDTAASNGPSTKKARTK